MNAKDFFNEQRITTGTVIDKTKRYFNYVDLASFAEAYHTEQLKLYEVSHRRELLKLKDFVKEQKDLPEEFVKIVNDNFWELL